MEDPGSGLNQYTVCFYFYCVEHDDVCLSTYLLHRFMNGKVFNISVWREQCFTLLKYLSSSHHIPSVVDPPSTYLLLSHTWTMVTTRQPPGNPAPGTPPEQRG